MMPTKARREKEAAKRAIESEHVAILGPALTGARGGNPFAAAKEWATQHPQGLFEIDDDGNVCQHPAIGSGGNRARKEEKEKRIRVLQRKNASAWGKRGVAKTIDTDDEDGLTVRTIQRYFKATK